MVCPANVISFVGGGEGSKLSVAPLMITADDPAGRDRVVLPTVIVPPGANVCPCMSNWDAELPVKVCPANVISFVGVADSTEVAKLSVAPLMTTTDDAAGNEIVVLLIVIALPGAKVCPCIAN